MRARLRFVLPTLFLIAAHNVCTAVNISEGLIHLWHLDETTGNTAFDSIGNWHLHSEGNAIFGAPGVNASGILFDGSSAFLVSTPKASDFLASDFTISLWLRWTSAAGKPGILEFRSNTGLRDLSIDLGYSTLEPSVNSNSTNLRIQSSESIGDGEWHLLSLVQQGNDQFLYLDAELVGSDSQTLRVTGEETFRLGRYEVTHFFGGTMDEVAIYNRALTPSEIASNSVPEPNFVLLLGLMAGWTIATNRMRTVRKGQRR